MSPILAIGLLLEGVKLATDLAIQVSKEEKTPEEALDEWQAAQANWNAAKDAWERVR
jgi:hypothetical protein